MSLSQAWATPFESCSPIRRFTSHKGQRHLSGLWWSATTGGHVGFESWMERDHVMALDFDPTVVGIASQPFWLSWRDDAGKLISHAPDFFARRADGTSVVVDCRPVERRKPRDAAKFEATARACAMVGWNYRLVGVPDPIVTARVASKVLGRFAPCEERGRFERPTLGPAPSVATTRALYNWDAPVDAPASGVAVRRREQSWQPAGHGRCAACASRRH